MNTFLHTVKHDKLGHVIEQIMRHHQLSARHAEFVRQGLLFASLRGVDTHGIRLLPTYIQELTQGRSNANPQFTYQFPTSSILQFDANNALGIVAGQEATQLLIKQAKVSGICAGSINNSNHFGAASYYTMTLAEAGLIGLCMSNGHALVKPFNGQDKLLGTNPISFAAPGVGEESFCLDMATSQVSHSKQRQSGGLTALQPLGGYKGQGLAMMVQILAGLLGDTPYDHEIPYLYGPTYEQPTKTGHFILAIDIARFVSLDHFKQRLSTLLSIFRQSKSDGEHPVVSAGENETATYFQRQRDGIPLTATEYDFFNTWAERLDCTLSAPNN